MNAKRLWITLMLVGVGIMGVSWYQQSHKPAPADANSAGSPASRAASAPSASAAPTATPASLPAAGTAAPSSAPAATTAATTAAPVRAFRPRWQQEKQPEVQWFPLGSLATGEGYPFRLEITSEGAAIGQLKLTDYFWSVPDKKLAARCGDDRAEYEKEVAAHPHTYHGNYSLLNPVFFGDDRYLSLATRRVRVWLPGQTEPVAWRLDNRQWKYLEGPTTQPDGSQALRFSWTMFEDANFADEAGAVRAVPFLTVVKTYQVRKKDYSITVSVEVVNESNLPLRVAIEQAGPTGIPREDPSTDDRKVVVGKVKDAEPYIIFRGREHLAQAGLGQMEPVGYSQEPEGRRMLWLGQTSRFFGSILYVKPPDANGLGWPGNNVQFWAGPALEDPHSRAFLTGVTIGEAYAGGPQPAPVELAAGKSFRVDLDLFAGPKKRDLFSDEEAAGYQPLYKKLNYLATIEFGSCTCSSNWLSLGMMWLLQFLSKIALGNYGIAIILLVLIVRAALHPLTRKGQIMMSKTQKMGPAMEKLKAKYADDKEQLQKEMMGLYRQQGFTPLLGCLPMMLQMPIWVALWSALNASVELRQSAFLPVWLTDLSSPDQVMQFGFALPLVGWRALNLLPILGCIATFIQMKYTPQGAPATTPEQQRQQAMMKYMMPVMMMFLFYNMPSGLNLYIMASGFLAAFESRMIRKHMDKKESESAVTQVAMPGKGFRGNRPKKPKGPYWVKRG